MEMESVMMAIVNVKMDIQGPIARRLNAQEIVQ